MSLLDRLLKNKEPKKDPFKNAPAFKKMMDDLQKEFIDRLEKILPVIVPNQVNGDTTTPEGLEHRIPEDALPVAYPINFDNDLSINLGINKDNHFDLLLNKDIILAKDKISPDQMVGKAFSNLFKQIENSISISMITEDTGKLTGCNGFETSLVLVNEIWKLIRDHLKTDEIVFGLPAQDIFVFAAAGNNEAVEKLYIQVKEHFDDPSCLNKISRKLYVMHKNGVNEILRLT